MIGYKIKIYVEIKNVVSCHEMIVSRHDTVVSWHDTTISCYEKVLYITMQTLVIATTQHNNKTTNNPLPLLRLWRGRHSLLQLANQITT